MADPANTSCTPTENAKIHCGLDDFCVRIFYESDLLHKVRCVTCCSGATFLISKHTGKSWKSLEKKILRVTTHLVSAISSSFSSKVSMKAPRKHSAVMLMLVLDMVTN